MANQLKMAMVHSIQTLLERGWSRRRIGRELGIDRETVGRYARMGSVPAAAPLVQIGMAPPGSDRSTNGFDGEGPSKPARAPPGSAFDPTRTYAASPEFKTSHPEAPPAPVIQPSRCEPFRAVIFAKLEAGLSAKRIHQDLTAEHGFAHQYHSVRRFVQHLRGTRPLPFRRMECAPGAEAQIDFGTGAPVIVPADPSQPNGKTRRRRTHVLRVVLSNSRKAYSEAVYRQTTEEFIRCLENAFQHFGGVPRTLVIDNFKAAVIQLGLPGRSSTHRSFDSIRLFKVSRNSRSFSVNFTLHHQDHVALLPDIDQASMGQEDHRDKPPYAVEARVFTQGWYLVEVDWDRLQVGLYVGLVARQVEPIAKLGDGGRKRIEGHCAQCREEAGVFAAFNRLHRDGAGPRVGQHRADALTELFSPLPMLCHLLPEVLGIKHKAIEQELRADVLAAIAAHVAPDPQPGRASAIRATLERERWVQR